jgi:hypothetical protein
MVGRCVESAIPQSMDGSVKARAQQQRRVRLAQCLLCCRLLVRRAGSVEQDMEATALWRGKVGPRGSAQCGDWGRRKRSEVEWKGKSSRHVCLASQRCRAPGPRIGPGPDSLRLTTVLMVSARSRIDPVPLLNLRESRPTTLHSQREGTTRPQQARRPLLPKSSLASLYRSRQ